MIQKNISEACKLIHYGGAVTINDTWHYNDGLRERHNKGQRLKKMCSKCPIYSYWLSPISLCLYRIRSFIVVGPFKNATRDFIIIIVNTLFLYNIIRMPYFVDGDELTLTFLP